MLFGNEERQSDYNFIYLSFSHFAVNWKWRKIKRRGLLNTSSESVKKSCVCLKRDRILFNLLGNHTFCGAYDNYV